jgi:hypothetical protein
MVAVDAAKHYGDIRIELVAVIKQKEQGIVVYGDYDIILLLARLVSKEGIKIGVVGFIVEAFRVHILNVNLHIFAGAQQFRLNSLYHQLGPPQSGMVGDKNKRPVEILCPCRNGHGKTSEYKSQAKRAPRRGKTTRPIAAIAVVLSVLTMCVTGWASRQCPRPFYVCTLTHNIIAQDQKT